MKIFVAIPCYGATLSVETCRALLNEQSAAFLLGHELYIGFRPGCSLITAGRNQLADDFLKSDCDSLVFVDADVSWEPGSLLKLASHPVDFVTGAYRHKKLLESYPIDWIAEGELWARNGLLEIASCGFGFTALKRAAFDQFREKHGERLYSHDGHRFSAYFTAPYRDGCLMGEDGAFCFDYRAAGGTAWLDPELALTHHDGLNAYPGHIGNWLKARIPAALPARLDLDGSPAAELAPQQQAAE